MRVLPLGGLAPVGDWQLRLPHTRRAGVLIHFVRAQGLVLIDGKRRGMGANSVLYVPANTLFALDPGAQAHARAVLFPETFEPALPSLPALLRIGESPATRDLAQMLDAMEQEAAEARAYADLALSARGALVSIWLRRVIGDHGAGMPVDKSSQLMRRFWNRLGASEVANEPMDVIGESLGVTPAHLARVSRALTGYSAAELRNQSLVHTALSLLIDTPAPVGNIARHLGFSSAANFSRFLRQHVGQSPREFRGQAKPRP